VDPVAGTLQVPDGPPGALPPEVVGLTQLDDRPVLATADQRLHVLDPVDRRLVRSFPAVVVPARRFNFGECAMLVAGRDWIASLDQQRGLLFFYAADGTALGRVALAPILGTRIVYTVRGAGDYLGVGHDTSVTTLRVVPDPACSAATPDSTG
jgi:hypothetical protein